MIFQITEALDAKLVSLTNRSESHGEDSVPAISMGFETETDNTILDRLGDGQLRFAMYYGDDKQADVPGVVKTTPHLRTSAIDKITIEQKPFEGWTLKVNHGIKDDEPLTFGSCKVDAFTAYPKARGTTILKFRVGTSDISAESLGIIGMKVGQSVSLLLTAPRDQPPKATDKGAPLFEGNDVKPAPKHKPGAAERAAVAKVKGGKAPAPAHKPSKAEARAAAEKAFEPEKPKPVVTTRQPAGSRTARGLEKTKAALAAGAKTAQVSPAGAWPFPKNGASNEAPPQSVTTENVKGGKDATGAFLESQGA